MANSQPCYEVRYTRAYKRDIDFRIALEVSDGLGWTVKSRWMTPCPDSLDRSVEWAKKYVEWLNEVA